MDDNHWKVLNENIYVFLENKRITFKNVQSKYKVRFNFKGVVQIIYMSQINKDYIKIAIMYRNTKIIIARLNIIDFQLKKLFSYFKLQKCLLFVSNQIFWQNYNLTATNTWKSKNIRAFKLTGFYKLKVPYELKQLIPRFINIKQICKSFLPQNYVSERINDIFLQTFKINNLNEELVETRQIDDFYIQKYEMESKYLQHRKNQMQYHIKIYYVDSDYVKNAQGVYGKFQINNELSLKAISKLKDIILIFYFSNEKSYLYIKNIHTKQYKIFDFGQQYNPLTMRNPKFIKDNLVFRERYSKRRILTISISDKLVQLKKNY